MTTSWDLPDELLSHILQYLDLDSQKEARLTCNGWSEVGTHGLFHTIYFAPRSDIISIFKEIIEKPTLAAKIKELVYDARLFWAYIAEPVVYANAFNRHFSELAADSDDNDGWPDVARDDQSDHDSDSSDSGDGSSWSFDDDDCPTGPPSRTDVQFAVQNLRDSRLQYMTFLEEQTTILTSGQDMDALWTGLKRLPNLTKVSILDKFEHPLDHQPFLWGQHDHEKYDLWSHQSFGYAVAPSTWHEAEMARLQDPRPHAKAARSQGRRGEIDPTPIKDFPWDFRGIHNLFTAIAEYVPRLAELYVGCQESCLSAEVYAEDTRMSLWKQIAPRLMALKADCQNGLDFDKNGLPHGMAPILHEAKHLEQLYIQLYGYTPVSRRILLNYTWPRLKMLDLTGGELEASDFKAVCRANAHVLRELRLSHLNIRRTPPTWRELATDVGAEMNLSLLALSALVDEVDEDNYGDPYLYPGELGRIGRALMPRVGLSQIGAVGSEGTPLDPAFVMLWDKTEHVPTPGFDTVCREHKSMGFTVIQGNPRLKFAEFI